MSKENHDEGNTMGDDMGHGHDNRPAIAGDAERASLGDPSRRKPPAIRYAQYSGKPSDVLRRIGIRPSRETMRSAAALEGWHSKLIRVCGLSHDEATAMLAALVDASQMTWLQLPALWSDLWTRITCLRQTPDEALAQTRAIIRVGLDKCEPQSYSHWGMF